MLLAALTRLPLYGLLALAPLAVSAQIDPPFATAQASLADDGEDDLADDSVGLSSMQPAAPPTRSVRKLSDSELTCSQIYAET